MVLLSRFSYYIEHYLLCSVNGEIIFFLHHNILLVGSHFITWSTFSSDGTPSRLAIVVVTVLLSLNIRPFVLSMAIPPSSRLVTLVVRMRGSLMESR